MIPKFRAWDKVNKEMIEDVTSIHFKTGMITTSNLYFYPFTDIELMQSTGLKDKNGKEIFEGDVIGSEDINAHDWKFSLHQIVKQDCGLMGKQICSNGSYIGIEHWTTGKNPFVVIGNIHEHSYLLESN